ncbi:ShlB/FhaC/HecB family hemolysin secretion/activation protein [Thermosynechococcus sp. JY1334]|uniref:ShlB/FhaC/HecB family hemolysin secretion/activation protein n=1 Tax=unclassified Thermosynechococcus TaxID=2622553 RepID=UPI002673EC01|nr:MULTISPECIES: ShlB/FhaC/HecB family hemolysin secretion/activation protein [unclassified Thermosynechococcus]MDR7898814.1 ShlB/FhaC/HecB family hemolysin secretion/activation protein [Thermosynechococcus sp. JY1332]MDR7906219.1 ShlB/FhaC/HecB family hemolysin secretion/activation protein [Thermosynechococcus sp. JY1334]WKT85944.1 ShlB/FhaC/HecB family hemolysin secretion/activation protein [Thermosynechococcus sp. JY1339]WNC54886.1 ShlB/FhaC/HecB family hemolysin secretion/activation protein
MISVLGLLDTNLAELQARVLLAQAFSPERLIEEIQPPPLPPREPKITIPEGQEIRPPTDSDQIRFLLKDIIISGSTVYSPEALKALYADQLNRNVTLADIYTIAQKISEHYRRSGYLLIRVLVPAQEVTEGIVRLKVVEGYVEEVRFEGSAGTIKPLQPYADRIQSSRPLRTKVLERNLLLMSDLAGYKVSGRFEAGNQPGATILTITAKKDSFQPFFTLNNWYADSVGPIRLQAGAYFNSLLNRGEQFILSSTTVPFDFNELKSGRFDVNIPLDANSLKFVGSFSYAESEPGDNLAPFRIKSNSWLGSIGFSYYPIRSRKLNLLTSASFDALNSTVSTTFLGPQVLLSQDRVRVFRASSQVTYTNRVGFTSASIQLSQGIAGLGARLSGTPTLPLSRFNATPAAFKANLDFTQIFFLPKNWSVSLTGAAQTAAAPLVASEQFGIGGFNSGSAYVQSAILGDDGYALRLELQHTRSYKFRKTSFTSQPYAFVDYGQTFLKRPTIAEPSSQEALSTGLGLRQLINPSLQLRLELAFPLTRIEPAFERSPRLFFQVQGIF